MDESEPDSSADGADSEQHVIPPLWPNLKELLNNSEWMCGVGIYYLIIVFFIV